MKLFLSFFIATTTISALAKSSDGNICEIQINNYDLTLFVESKNLSIPLDKTELADALETFCDDELLQTVYTDLVPFYKYPTDEAIEARKRLLDEKRK